MKDHTAAIFTTNDLHAVNIFKGCLTSLARVVVVARGIARFTIRAWCVLALASKLDLIANVRLALVDHVFARKGVRKVLSMKCIEDFGNVVNVVVPKIASCGALNVTSDSSASVLWL